MNKGSGETGPELEAEIDKLRRDEWPSWIYRHSYLAGLDGELPASAGDKSADKDTRTAVPNKGERTARRPAPLRGAECGTATRRPRPTRLCGRLAAALKQEETRNGEEFKAIGVLGSDVYDKLLILQALRPSFPQRHIFHHRPERQTELSFRMAMDAQSHHRVTFRTGTSTRASETHSPISRQLPDIPVLFRLVGTGSFHPRIHRTVQVAFV